MNTRDNTPKASDLPPEVQAELVRRRDAVDAGEPTVEGSKVFDQLRRNLRERSEPLPG